MSTAVVTIATAAAIVVAVLGAPDGSSFRLVSVVVTSITVPLSPSLFRKYTVFSTKSKKYAANFVFFVTTAEGPLIAAAPLLGIGLTAAVATLVRIVPAVVTTIAVRFRS